MKIIIHTKNLSLTKSQDDFIAEKVKKIRELSKHLNDESHQIHIDFEYIESKIKEESIICTATLNFKGNKSIRIEKKSDTVEKSFYEVKKVLIEEIKKLKDKSSYLSINSRILKKIKSFFKK